MTRRLGSPPWRQAHPYWVFPIAFAIAFSESFVGVSFIVPGHFLLVTLGGVIGASHISLFPAWAGAVMGSVLGDWISWWIGFHYHHKIVHFWLFRRFEDQIEKAPAPVSQLGHLGDFHRPFPGTLPRHRAAGGGHVRAGILALHDRQHRLGRDLGLCPAGARRRDSAALFPITH